MTSRPRPLEMPDLADLARVITMHGDSWEQLGLDAEGFGAVGHQGRVLAVLAEGPSSVGALAEPLGVTAQRISKVATDLADQGYLTVLPDHADGRARVLQLTPLGQAYVAARRKVRNATAREQQRWLGTRDFAELVRLLEALAELFEPPDRRA